MQAEYRPERTGQAPQSAAGSSLVRRGWAFPPRFSSADGVALVEADRDISEAIKILVLTRLGERIMRPNFGAGLEEFLFENIRPELIERIAHNIRVALAQFEPELTIDSLSILPRPREIGRLDILLCWSAGERGSPEIMQIELELASGQIGVAR